MNNSCTTLLLAIKRAADFDNVLTQFNSVVNNDVEPHVSTARNLMGIPTGRPTIEGPDPVQRGMGGALAGAGLGALLGGGLQFFRREVSRKPEKDKPSIMRGLLGGAGAGALLGGGASYVHAGDSYRTSGLDSAAQEIIGKTAPSLDLIPGMKEKRDRMMAEFKAARPGFRESIFTTMNPKLSPAARLLELLGPTFQKAEINSRE